MAEQNYYALSVTNGREFVYGQGALQQCIKLLILTPKYAIPLSRVYCGLLDKIDKPLALVKLELIADINDVLRTWELRITLNSISFATPTDSTLGITINYTDNATGQSNLNSSF